MLALTMLAAATPFFVTSSRMSSFLKKYLANHHVVGAIPWCHGMTPPRTGPTGAGTASTTDPCAPARSSPSGLALR